MVVKIAVGFHKSLRSNNCSGLGLLTLAKKLVGLCACCKRCTPDHAALVAMLHDSAC